MVKEELEEGREEKACFVLFFFSPSQFSHLDVYDSGSPEKPPFLTTGPIKTGAQEALACLSEGAIKTTRWTHGTEAW